jgi:hypothetical protein
MSSGNEDLHNACSTTDATLATHSASSNKYSIKYSKLILGSSMWLWRHIDCESSVGGCCDYALGVARSTQQRGLERRGTNHGKTPPPFMVTSKSGVIESIKAGQADGLSLVWNVNLLQAKMPHLKILSGPHETWAPYNKAAEAWATGQCAPEEWAA